MSGAEANPNARRSGVPHVVTRNSPRMSLLLRELPFSAVLILTILGVAYTSFSKEPIVTYWELLAPIIGLVCIGAGWQNASDKAGKLRLI